MTKKGIVMKQRYLLFRRAGVFYYEDTTTGKQLSLRTKDEAEAITLLADPDWLDDATKIIGQYWRRKNAQRHGLTLEKLADAAPVDSVAPSKNCF
jgi:hypothetical protein